jgi:hypothetical protein
MYWILINPPRIPNMVFVRSVNIFLVTKYIIWLDLGFAFIFMVVCDFRRGPSMEQWLTNLELGQDWDFFPGAELRSTSPSCSTFFSPEERFLHCNGLHQYFEYSWLELSIQSNWSSIRGNSKLKSIFFPLSKEKVSLVGAIPYSSESREASRKSECHPISNIRKYLQPKKKNLAILLFSSSRSSFTDLHLSFSLLSSAPICSLSFTRDSNPYSPAHASLHPSRDGNPQHHHSSITFD